MADPKPALQAVVVDSLDADEQQPQQQDSQIVEYEPLGHSSQATASTEEEYVVGDSSDENNEVVATPIPIPVFSQLLQILLSSSNPTMSPQSQLQGQSSVSFKKIISY